MKKIPQQIENYLPKQYLTTGELAINHNYLQAQFYDYDLIFAEIKKVVLTGDFTLGKEVDVLEAEYASLCNTRYAVSVGSGTDALFLSLKALDIGPGDEVITTPFTFYATVGAIVTAGAKPVFVDVKDDYNINVDAIEEKISEATKAIIPVHWSGRPCDMDKLEYISKKYDIPVISDACHAINAKYKSQPIGGFGTASCFSFHPLKNLNVWGDGGMITTNSPSLANRLKLIRNHGLLGRDECVEFGYNSRLDTIQAVVARHMLKKIDSITAKRRWNAHFFDLALQGVTEVLVPVREAIHQEVFHIYSLLFKDRDGIKAYLIRHGVDAKIHYPTPIHLQPAALFLGHNTGDFPTSEHISAHILSLPVHEFITVEQMQLVVNLIKKYYE